MKTLTFVFIVILTACQSNPSTEANEEVVDLAADIVTDQLHDTLKMEPTEVFSIPGGCCVGDYDLGRVVCTDMNLKAKLIFGSKGQGPGEMMSPQYGYCIDRKFYVLDHMRDGIEIFGGNGLFEREVRVPAEYDKFSQFALYGEQEVLFSTGYLSTVGLTFDLNKLEIKDSFGEGEKPIDSIIPANLHVTKDDNVIVVFWTDPRVIVYDADHKKLLDKDMSEYSFISDMMEFNRKSGFKKENLPLCISNSKFDPLTQRLYLMVYAFYPEYRGPHANVLYEFQYENAQITLRNTYRLLGATASIPAFLVFTVESGKVFAWDSYNKDFYRYSLPD